MNIYFLTFGRLFDEESRCGARLVFLTLQPSVDFVFPSCNTPHAQLDAVTMVTRDALTFVSLTEPESVFIPRFHISLFNYHTESSIYIFLFLFKSCVKFFLYIIYVATWYFRGKHNVVVKEN